MITIFEKLKKRKQKGSKNSEITWRLQLMYFIEVNNYEFRKTPCN